MTVLSGQSIRHHQILSPCLERTTEGGLTYGLGPAGYDLRLDLGELFTRNSNSRTVSPGDFVLAATLERFTMPNDVLGVVHDKSTLARRGLTVQNTIIEPGWRGWLTLELVNHSRVNLVLVQGQAIAQVVFHRLDAPAEQPYHGKYQDQPNGPVGPR